ncbi:MAG TPA: serine hydrolase domain-containing protein [Pyrinomonadaceae bacterium]|nr:serine hydrolase domain-containing protein [Pyrinomonadaceae bacterium]
MPAEQPAPSCTCFPEDSVVQAEIESFYQNLPDGEVASGVSVGVVNGVDSSGDPVITRCYSGYANVKEKRAIKEDTVFEIGSTTKTFTATMLAAAVNDGKTTLDCSAQLVYQQNDKPSVVLPTYTDPITGFPYEMTMLDLADYTSGISDKSPTNTKGPNEYKYSMMHEYLKDLGSLSVQPGTEFNYVNTNFGIIAELMMLMGKFSDYKETLKDLKEKAGLTMNHTGVIESNDPTHHPEHHLAKGYKYNGDEQKNYALPTWPALQGAGAIYSTVDDMLEWLQFNMGLTESPYNVLLPMLQEVRFPAGKARGEGLGWFISDLKGTKLKLIHKNGGTAGFHSWIGFLPDSTIGAVVLCNTAMPGSLPINNGSSPVDNLGLAILKALAQPS